VRASMGGDRETLRMRREYQTFRIRNTRCLRAVWFRFSAGTAPAFCTLEPRGPGRPGRSASSFAAAAESPLIDAPIRLALPKARSVYPTPEARHRGAVSRLIV
jgi:hypothetical protein